MKRAFMKRMSAVLAAWLCLTLVLGIAPAFAAAESPAALKNAGTAEASFTAAPSIIKGTESGDTSTEPLPETDGELLPPTVDVPDISENENGITEENTQTGSPSETDGAPADNASADNPAVTDITDITEESGTGTPAVSPDASEPATVTFHNELKKGSLKVTKTADDGFVEGLRFHLYGTSLVGENVDMYAVTDASGIATFNDVPISGTTPYTLEEVETPNRYFTPVSQNAEIVWNEVTNASFENKLKPGSVKVIKTAEDNLVEGLKFHLFGVSITGETVDMYAETDASGVAIFNDVPVCGAEPYIVEEVDTPERYIVPASQSAAVITGETTELNFHNELKRGGLKIVKTSEDGKVEGISFTVTGNGVNMTVTTGAKGVIEIPDLLPGEYVVAEIVPDGYVEQPAQNVTVIYGETAVVSFHNILQRGGLKIVKTSEDGNVEGISFTVTGNGVNMTVTTGAKGIIEIPDLLPGEYVVAETVPDGYVEQPAQNVTVIYGETAVISFHNILQRGGLKIVKTSEDGKVEGISFTVTGNGVNMTVTTGAKGIIEIPDLLPGEYVVTEAVPEGYLSQPPKTVNVIANEITTVTFNNILKRGGLRIIKTSENGVIEGISFVIEGNGVNMTVTTGADGTVFVSDLLPGTYTVTEIVPDGYIPQEPKTVVVTADGETNIPASSSPNAEAAENCSASNTGYAHAVNLAANGKTKEDMRDEPVYLAFSNILKKGGVKVIKSSDDNFVEGIKFHLFGVSETGETIDMYAVTDASGAAMFSDVPICGETPYTLEEVETSERYIVPEAQEVTVIWDMISVAQFHNTLKKGNLTIIKTSDDNIVQGFSFRVTGENGYDEIFITDESGKIIIENLIAGKYTVSEVENDASSRYFIPEDVTVEVGSDSAVTVEMHNSLIPGAPQTGDRGNLGLGIAAIAIAAFLAAVGIVIARKERQIRKKNKK